MNRNGGSVSSGMVAQSWPDWWLNWVRNTHLYVGGAIATVVGLFLLLLNEQIVGLLQIETNASFLYLIPLVIMFSAVLQVTQQWIIRKKKFKVKARVASLQALILNGSKVGFGLFYPFATVLIILTVFGQALQAFMLIIGLKI